MSGLKNNAVGMTETRIAFGGLTLSVIIALFSFWMYVSSAKAEIAAQRLYVAENYMKSSDIKESLKEIKQTLARIEEDLREKP